MARRPTPRQVIEDLLDQFEPEIAQAFLDAIDDLRNAADIRRVVAALQAGNIEAALDALHLDTAAFGPLEDAIAKAFAEGGRNTASTFPALRDATQALLVVRFNARNPRAEAWLRDHSASLVTRILDDQRTAIRQALTTGMEQGRNPRGVALEIVGRINRTTGAREGGLLGLTAAQERAVEAARAELASGDAPALRNYLGRARRDKRFDRSVTKAIRDGDPIPAEIQAKALVAYERRLLQLRGETIGQKEAFTAIATGKNEAIRQAIEAGAVDAAAVTKRWRHFPNEHPRRQHIQMNGKVVRFDQPFVLPDGTRMMHPHDPDAPIEHTAGCHCQADYKIDFLASLA